MSTPLQEWRLEVGGPEHGARLDAFLHGRLPWRSRERLRALIEAGRVVVLAGKDLVRPERSRVRVATRLRTGEEIVVQLDAAQVEAEEARTPGAEHEGARSQGALAIPVAYEDPHLLVVSKPPHVNVYPSRRHRSGSLIELVHRRHRELGGAGAPPSPCHRLDRETSGLVVFAKDRETRAHIGRQLEERSVTKVYLALVVGRLEAEAGEIDAPIARAPASRVEIKRAVVAGGEPARTRYRVRVRYAERTLLELYPETGRQHQLRVHLAALGHPIVGDKLYGGGDETFLRALESRPCDLRYGLGLDHHALHAWRLELDHPQTGERLALEAPLWPDVAALLERDARSDASDGVP
jgi:23S rRNA pseudouridine1911/1915/1917 synthase